MGCRRGVPVAELEQLLVETFRRHNLALASLRCIATAELKGDEPGLLALAERYGVPLVCYGAQELNRAFEGGAAHGATPSQAARRLLGVWGVSEPAALLASGSTELVVPRQKAARATVAVARVVFG
jgi:cobalt-precorrin 5A hydrolase